jgi:hypothetical protein
MTCTDDHVHCLKLRPNDQLNLIMAVFHVYIVEYLLHWKLYFSSEVPQLLVVEKELGQVEKKYVGFWLLSIKK